MKSKSTQMFTLITVLAASAYLMVVPSAMSQGRGQNKVTICHRGRTIEVAEPAVQAHLRHGDELGPCAVTPNGNT